MSKEALAMVGDQVQKSQLARTWSQRVCIPIHSLAFRTCEPKPNLHFLKDALYPVLGSRH